MKTEAVQIAARVTLVLSCAAVQDLMPVCCGIKPPLLLVFATRAGLPAAVAAGLCADALSGTPFGCQALFFAAASFARTVPAVVATAFLAPLWLALWGEPCAGAAPFCSAAFAVPLAFVARVLGPHLALHVGLPQRKQEAPQS